MSAEREEYLAAVWMNLASFDEFVEWLEAQRDEARAEALVSAEGALIRLSASPDYDPWASAIVSLDAVKAVREALA